MMLVPALFVAVTHTALAGAPPATKADVDATVKAVRKEYEAVAKKGGGASILQKASMTIGGGQNPSEIQVVYEGGSEADYQNDPYAAPFHLRQVTVAKTLPAVGEASVQLTFDKRGALMFAYATGSDISGVSAFEMRPTDELRVYFHEGQAVRAVFRGAENDGKDVTLDVIGPEKDAARVKQAGAALAKYAADLKQALTTLAR